MTWQLRIVHKHGQMIMEMPDVKQKGRGMIDPKLLDKSTVYIGCANPLTAGCVEFVAIAAPEWVKK